MTRRHIIYEIYMQAVAYQVSQVKYHPPTLAQVPTFVFIRTSAAFTHSYHVSLLRDYRCVALPTTQRLVVKAHTDNVKCVQWVGSHLASGSRHVLI